MYRFFKEKIDQFNKKQNDRFMSLLSSSFYEKTGLIFDPTNKEDPYHFYDIIKSKIKQKKEKNDD